MKKTDIIIIPAGGYNWASIQDAVIAVGYDAAVSDNWEVIKNAKKIILPGVGSSAQGIRALKKTNLYHNIMHLRQDVLGICLGMQLLFSRLEEDNQMGLGIIEGSVHRIPSTNIVPHIGWNQLELQEKKEDGIIKGVPSNAFVYFVHSYYASPKASHTITTTTYEEISIASIVKKRNFYGLQFHPERSGKVGLDILRNFITL